MSIRRTARAVKKHASLASKGPAKIASLGEAGWIAQPKGGRATKVIDRDLAETSKLEGTAHGQIAGSRDGKRAAVWTLDGMRVFDATTGKELGRDENVEWWAENSGGLSFDHEGRVWFVSLVDDEEREEVGGEVAIASFDPSAPKKKRRSALRAIDDASVTAHYRMFSVDGDAAILWLNEAQDRQSIFRVERGDDGFPEAGPIGEGLLLGAFGDRFYVGGWTTIAVHDAKSGELEKTIDLSKTLTNADEVLSVAGFGDALIAFVILKGDVRVPMLIRDGADTIETIEIEGCPAKGVSAMTGNGREVAVLYEDGTLAVLAP
jgi:hypothetical protein